MENSSHGPANFWTQSNALLRKNLLLQKRNKWANIRLITFPVFLFIFMAALETYVKIMLKGKDFVEKCNNNTLPSQEGTTCPIRSPVEWPPLLEVPSPLYRAVRTNDISFKDLPDMSCKKSGSCPATILITGNNQSLGKSLGETMFTSSFTLNSSDTLYSLASAVLGSSHRLGATNYRGLLDENTVYQLQPNCSPDSTFSVPIQVQSTSTKLEVKCLQSLLLWRDSSSEIKDELFKGYYRGNSEGLINEIVAAYDFLNSNQMNFNVSIWYNSTNNMELSGASPSLRRVPRSVNLVSNAYLQFLRGPKTQMLLEFVKEMPKSLSSKETLDLSSMLATLLFTFVILQLFPVILTTLVYEKQQKLRIMMKMHGLCDGPYWMISYGYFLAISSIYMLLFVLFGSLVGLRFFTLNAYSIQFVFYFVYINVQILFAFLLAAFFSRVKPATASAYAIVFGTGLAGKFLFESLVKDATFPRGWITAMEFYPGFSLQRGLYEFSEYALMGSSGRTHGMLWHNLNDRENGMKEVLIIMLTEWFMLLFVAYYLDQVTSSGSGIRRSPLFFFQNFRKKPESSFQISSMQGQESDVCVQMEKADVAQEREKAEQLLVQPNKSYAVVCNNLAKVHPGRDGNPEKVAVKGLSLALRRGECFGMLGPSGAGKTSFIEMMIGLTSPSSGRAYVEGLDLQTNMDAIYTCMGVCPQHDLLWETLTGREHLLFYGRLKKLEGAALNQAVEESLKNLGIFHGGVADKAAGSYSGGMKRRLSVAISLIGNPSVVYMDEPSTGLDPASRNTLWNVVKRAKQERAIILTTHSMEEAEFLCDRLGIFVDGSMQCIGNPKELRARYGGSYVFTITTSASHEEEVESMVRRLSSNANKTYHLSGTQKFELPKNEVRIGDVFEAVANAKKRFTVHAWGLADTTLEDVFIKVAHGAEAFKA